MIDTPDIGTAAFLPVLANQEDSTDAGSEEETSRGRNQNRARVAGGQDYEVRYEAPKTGQSKSAEEGGEEGRPQRKKVERRLGRSPIGSKT